MTARKKSPAVGTSTGQGMSEESIRCEARLLKSLFKRPAIFDHLGDSIQPEHFGHLGYGRLFRAMRSGYLEHDRILPGRCVYALRAGSGMPTTPSPDGCRFELMRLMAGFIDWWHWPYYAQQVREAAKRRRLLRLADKIRLAAITQPQADQHLLLQKMEGIVNG